MKQVVFLAICHGIDGRAPESIAFASLVESQRDEWIETNPSKPWFTAVDRVADLNKVALTVCKKINSLEKLALLLTEDWKNDE